MRQLYILTVITPTFTGVRIFVDPAKAIREASITRNEYSKVSWLETKDGHASVSGTFKVTVKPITVE